MAAQRQERFPHLLLTSLIPIGNLEAARVFLADLDRVLQGADSLQIFLIVGVHQYADCYHQIARADLVLAVGVTARAVDDLRHVFVLVEYLHRHEALAGVGQRDRDGPGVEIEHRGRVERVAVHADDVLVLDVCRLAVVLEFAEAAFPGDGAEI